MLDARSQTPGSLEAQTGSLYVDPEPFEVCVAEHSLRFLPAGKDRFRELVALIDEATTSLKVFFYLFQPDYAGSKVRDALLRAATRGVDVHLIVDSFGSDAPPSFFEPLQAAGGRYSVFSPRLGVRYLIRNHQKCVIVDDKQVMTGGFNVSDHYFKPPDVNGWCDLGVVIEGPVVQPFCEWFEQLEQWVNDKNAQFRAIRHLVRDWNEGRSAIQLLLGGPTKITSAWARRVKEDIAQGQRLDMVMAYFSPPRSMRRLIKRLAERGKARLIMAGKSDNRATIGASRSFYRSMLRSGVEIAEFQPCKLHMKLLVIDDVTYIGSANFDMRSIRLNLELMLRIVDADLANHMREIIDHMAQHSDPVTNEWYRKRASGLNRLRWWLGRFLVTGVDYTVTRRLNLGI
ncbi:phospholipase D-like domain-containing protein [Altererythrobacter lutimaris]|uniref:Phospholipase D n=1 Tax=Altererythrobacter lutimaris TaxID=2743979 RepID=A0A850HIU9_9SPHN|nr:phosphatidylserine/phosphatidylglycerophosphate/cardiolipin synthase family protein [Altererythrobacter lutimaris]NVE95752.1 phosphatidylserine/phosphatidylglycerophosphate/cardiolipin synthase family protein [Altererythrobacter lutimaris]